MEKSKKFEQIFNITYFIICFIMLIISLFFTWTINNFVEEIFLAFSVICFASSNIYISNTKSRFKKIIYIALIIFGYIATMFSLIIEMAYGTMETGENLWHSTLENEETYLFIASILTVAICIISIIFYNKEKVEKVCNFICKLIGIISFISLAVYVAFLCVSKFIIY